MVFKKNLPNNTDREVCSSTFRPFLKVEISVFSIVPPEKKKTKKKTKREFLPNNQNKNRPGSVSGDWNEAVLALWLCFLLSLFSSKGLGLGWKQFTGSEAMCYRGDKATLFTLLPNIHAATPPPPPLVRFFWRPCRRGAGSGLAPSVCVMGTGAKRHGGWEERKEDSCAVGRQVMLLTCHLGGMGQRVGSEQIGTG